MGQPQHLDIKEVGDVTVVNFCEHVRSLRTSASKSWEKSCSTWCKRKDCKKLLLDFSAVDFLSSSALGKLITLDKRIRTRGGTCSRCAAFVRKSSRSSPLRSWTASSISNATKRKPWRPSNRPTPIRPFNGGKPNASSMSANRWLWQCDRVIPSETGAGQQLVQEMLEQLEQNHWIEHDLFGVHLAVEEAMMNAIKHGNRYRRRQAGRRSPAAFPASCCVIEITDEGQGFDPSQIPDPTDPENLEKPSGRGVMLMRNFMTRMSSSTTWETASSWRRSERTPNSQASRPR